MPVQRLDDYLAAKGIDAVSMIKIDTEGFELPVLQGAMGFLRAHRQNLPVILAEITPKGFHLAGQDIGALRELMVGLGYVCRDPWDLYDVAIDGSMTRQTDVLFVPPGR